MLARIKDLIKGIPGKRSSKWASVRKEFLLKNPTCSLCGGKSDLEVHHIKPFHLHPELELDLNNLITLCESKKNGINCHLAFGHLGSYKSVNKDVVEDTKKWNNKLATR
jgi:5-methylcytosine-specific restriction endonuclease McrA